MLRSIRELQGYTVGATDGAIGHVKDCYFDDEAWVIRYLVVETWQWLKSRRVLISPIAISRQIWSGNLLPVSITKEQVRNSPDIDTDKPVSRQHEIGYFGYYGYPYYWGSVGLWGGGMYPGSMLTEPRSDGTRETSFVGAPEPESELPQDGDQHLRSCKTVMKYHVHAADGDIGHVEGLLIDEETWSIRYMIVGTSNWWSGHQVLIAPQWVEDISWIDQKVSVNLTRQAVKDSPPYDAAAPLDREHEAGVYEHYRRAGYWANEVKLENPQFRPMAAASPGAIGKTLDGAARRTS